MKKLQLIKADVIPAKPESNTLYIIGNTIIAYSDNNSILSTLSSQEESQEVTIDNLPGATAQGISIVKASTPQAVRTIIGAGTSSLTIGTTAGTAKAGDWVPPFANESTGGYMTGGDKAKLNAIQAEATKNQTDAFLLSRANHTGTQTIATITGVVPIAQIPIGTTATTVKLGNYTPSATEIVTAINAMTPEQVTAVQTKLGITPTP